MLVEHMRDGASVMSFAGEIGVARSTINQWAEDYPEFGQALARGKSIAAKWWEDHARKLVIEGGTGPQASMIMFGLKNMSALDWRDKQEIDHTSSDGSMTPKEPSYRLVGTDD